MDYPFIEADEALKKLKTSAEGVSQAEAEARLKIYGENSVEDKPKGGVIKLFFAQFKDFMTLLLIAAAVVSGAVAFVSRDVSDLTDTCIILGIIFLNAFVGAVQQFRADRAIENLNNLSRGSVKVRRDGKTLRVDSRYITVGDIVLLDEGDVAPADCRIIECDGLQMDESALTGESCAVLKSSAPLKSRSAGLTDMTNMAWRSTFVSSGSATCAVVAVGAATESGKIAGMLSGSDKSMTPLEKGLNRLGKIISALVLAVTALVFAVGLISGGSLFDNLMTALAIAVAAIPEGLPAVVTIIMAIGVQRMSKKSVVIRKLKSVETLGGCSVICTDKTGTLTQNKLRVAEVYGDGIRLSSGDISGANQKLLQCMVACNTVRGENGKYLGDPTEIALKLYADDVDYRPEFSRLAAIPFSSDRKLMSVAADFSGERLCLVKGAPDVILQKCSFIRTQSGVRALTRGDRERISAALDGMSDGALRVLGFAYRDFEDSIKEEGLIFIGLCGMRDGLKKGVKQAVAECRTAGIDVVMITGDHVRTAFAIARSLNIADDISQVMTGGEFENLNKPERERAIKRCKVFARVTPKHKNMIVRALKKQGEVVAMTGDGINDAPSIKAADIGVAMGVAGTDVTKNASDMVIADDNFATIVSGVREGRRISANIAKTIEFFLSTNLAEVLAILIAAFAFMGKSFLLSTQLLWLNLITDSFPVLALGVEREEADIMSRPPQRAERAIFNRRTAASIGFFGAYITAVTICVFAVTLNIYGNQTATAATFLTLSFSELFHAFNVRSARGSIFKSGLFTNKALLVTVALGVGINVLLALTPLGKPFGLYPLTLPQWLTVCAASLSVIPVGEVYKALLRARERSKKRRVSTQKSPLAA